MLDHGKLAELGIDMVVDSRRLGYGQIVKGRAGPGDVTYTNISTF